MGSVEILYLSYDKEGGALLEMLRRPMTAFSEGRSVEQVKKELLTGKYGAFITRCTAVSDVQLGLLRFIRDHNLQTRAIVSSRTGTVEDAVRVMKAGASDFIISDAIDGQLADSILQSVLGTSTGTLPPPHIAPPGTSDTILIGESQSIREMRFAISLVAKSNTAVLITGESGTGKEVVARLIHLQSARCTKPFVPINCAAFPKDVIENELFGHERGAFTGALMKKKGYFEMADQGTLFFDEIAEMNVETQAKLLRAIETKTFRRLGGKEEIHVDVRAVAATNKNIVTALKQGEFREDLYYRFSVIEILIPPLRDRREDIPLLLDHFLGAFSAKLEKPRKRFSEECIDILLEYGWPGNVRELQNLVERSMVICPGEVIGAEVLPERIMKRKNPASHISISVGSSTLEAERTLILQTLASVGNNKSKAAKILGVSRKTLHNKLRSFNEQKRSSDEQPSGVEEGKPGSQAPRGGSL